jgi:hypothetical protein
MIAIAVLAVALARFVALREEPLVADPPDVRTQTFDSYL